MPLHQIATLDEMEWAFVLGRLEALGVKVRLPTHIPANNVVRGRRSVQLTAGAKGHAAKTLAHIPPQMHELSFKEGPTRSHKQFS